MERGRNVARDSGVINKPRTTWTRTLVTVGIFALISGFAMVLDWVISAPRQALTSLPWMLTVFSTAFAVTAAFAVWTASSLRLLSFLVLSPLSARHRWWRFAIYGVGAGIFIYLTNNALYLTTSSASVRPSTVYDLDSHLQVFAVSARSAFSEETMFRLFAIPFLVSLGMRFYGWRPRFGFERGPKAPPRQSVDTPLPLVVAALVISALMFGMAHASNPLAATAFGLILGVSYLRGGWESAVTAHFLGNYLLFAGIYL